ncbi:MAG: dihydroorotase [Jaaginema sp. PMC 1079.18]|nr:dihydroorotase [Jaaginema sp. PMC 1080.18]MEC4850047.1 dihydroorotase [Jaaginema sp. PMC 1079.18]MEC4865147.1 dihydroorotase [Jaaginema sp. PMC 1078.18]
MNKAIAAEVIKQVRILDPVTQTDAIADVAIVSGKISQIAPQISEIPENAEIIESQGWILAPGLVDLYSYNSEPGFEDRETLPTLAASALAGGFTRVALLPNTHPEMDNAASLGWLSRNAPPAPKFYGWGAISQRCAGQEMTELAELAQSGCIGFTDSCPLDSTMLLRRVLEYGALYQKPVALVACDRALRGNGVMREGKLSIQAGLPGDPAMSETSAIASICEIVAELGTPVHFLRVSTQRGVEIIAQAKKRGLPITASTTWLHLLKDSRAVCSYDTNLRLDPPLGNPSDRMALIEGVKTGTIDAIAIDHAPYTYEEKTVAFATAPPGAIGLEFALPLLWQAFVPTAQLSPLTLLKALSVSPLNCLFQKPISIAVGHHAEFILFNPHAVWKVTANTLKSKSQNTSWLNREIKGQVVKVWC